MAELHQSVEEAEEDRQDLFEHQRERGRGDQIISRPHARQRSKVAKLAFCPAPVDGASLRFTSPEGSPWLKRRAQTGNRKADDFPLVRPESRPVSFAGMPSLPTPWHCRGAYAKGTAGPREPSIRAGILVSGQSVPPH